MEKIWDTDFQKIEKPKVLQADFHVQNNIRKKKIKSNFTKAKLYLHDSKVDTHKKTHYRLHDSEVDRETERSLKGLIALFDRRFFVSYFNW